MAISASSIASSSTLNELRTQFNNLVTDVTAIEGGTISFTALNTTTTNTTTLNVKEDGTKERSFRLGPAFSKIMDRMEDKEERESVIKDLIAVISGKSLSTKYKGRNKKELEAIEDEIINMIKPEV